MNSNEKTSKIIVNSLGNISDEASANLPTTSCLNRMVQSIRSQKEDHFPKFNDLSDLVIPEEYTFTIKGKPFLIHDSQDGKNRIIAFSTTKNLKLLKKCSIWLSDGTFKVVPVIFSQLYTLHGLYKGKVLPLVYFLLPNKKKKVYKSALNVIKNNIEDYEPSEILIDFEPAFIKSFNKLFPSTRIKCCFFHFMQCLYRHVQECGLQNMYTNDVAFMTSIKMIASLTFVPVHDVLFAYDSLIMTEYFVANDDLLSQFLNYFEFTWVGQKTRNNTRKPPLFGIDLWNSYEDVKNDLPRTNNAVEGWHHRFANIIDKQHAEIGTMINSIKKEQNLTEVLIEQLKTGREIAQPKRKKYKTFDTRLKNVIDDYDRDNIVEYLKNLSSIIAF